MSTPNLSPRRPGMTANADLRSRNSLALPGRARYLAHITSPAALPVLAADPAWRRLPRFVLGGGSNLVLQGDFDGLVLAVEITGRRLLAEDADAWFVEAAAGENWHDFVQWTLAQGWPGLENLSLIPGTVGAAPVQNIGAYGLEVAERLHTLQAFDLLRGQSIRLDHAACRFAYRDSIFRQEGWHLDGRFVITAVTFRLPKNWQPVLHYPELAREIATVGSDSLSAQQIADAVIRIRQRKLPDPARLANAGSFFHNPVVDAATAEHLATRYPGLPCYPQADGRCKLAAGWLIEQTGWKGRKLGPVGMYEQQALVLVNHGGACGADVLALAIAVRQAVHQQFGVELHTEPVFL